MKNIFKESIAGLISIGKLHALLNISKNFLLEFLQGNESSLTQEEIDAIVDETKHATRRKKS